MSHTSWACLCFEGIVDVTSTNNSVIDAAVWGLRLYVGHMCSKTFCSIWTVLAKRLSQYIMNNSVSHVLWKCRIVVWIVVVLLNYWHQRCSVPYLNQESSAVQWLILRGWSCEFWKYQSINQSFIYLFWTAQEKECIHNTVSNRTQRREALTGAPN